MKQIYILLSRTQTTPSRLIHLFSKGTYTHASIAIEEGTDKFFSFARRSQRNFLRSGLISEDIHKRTFALYPDAPCALYKIDISEDSYEIIRQLIEYYWSNYNKCKYNFWGIITIFFGKTQKLRFRMTCSQFVALLLHKSNAVSLPKEPSLMRPDDFLRLKDITLLYKGKLGDCHLDRCTVQQINFKM